MSAIASSNACRISVGVQSSSSGAKLSPTRVVTAAALAPGGLLAITTETGAADWTLLRSGRFSHADDYVHAAAQPNLRLLASKTTILRQEGAVGVAGTLHLFKRV